ncbi:MAG: sialidase family protein [bacterium]
MCCFRDGSNHVSDDGIIRVIASNEGSQWTSLSTISHPEADLRDPKLTVAPDGRLMLSICVTWNGETDGKPRTAWTFSSDGEEWSELRFLDDPDVWLWRLTWHKGTAYSMGYQTGNHSGIAPYTYDHNRGFSRKGGPVYNTYFPNEASVCFTDSNVLCLLRRNKGRQSTAILGKSTSFAGNWSWQELKRTIEGPHLINAPKNNLIAGGRILNAEQQEPRTAILSLELNPAELSELEQLPSGGDTGYPGVILEDGTLHISYYSSHESEKPDIYLATRELSRYR